MLPVLVGITIFGNDFWRFFTGLVAGSATYLSTKFEHFLVRL